MDDLINNFLAPRIIKNCVPLFKEGHFKHSAREAMVQVETALKEKGKVEDIKQFGARLIDNLFKGIAGLKLRVPLGDELQNNAKNYFKGVFSYYRNYTAHDGSCIDEKIAFRILIIASDMLELIDASDLTLTDIGGVEGLVRLGEFGDSKRLGKLLTILDNYHMPESTYDGLYEDLLYNGFVESELEAIFNLNLVEMHSTDYEIQITRFHNETESIEWLELTELGQKALQSINDNSA